MDGKLIVIAGTDGSGKHTQAKRLLARLLESSRQSEMISFPQYEDSFFGGLVGRYLRGEFGVADAVDPHLASLVFAMDRWEAREKLVEWLQQGRTVLADRYVSANAGHQSIKIGDLAERERFVAWVERMEYEILGLPRPDLTVFLHMPWRTAQELVGRKSERAYLKGAKRDIHEADDDHLARSEQAYLHMAKTRPRWRTIECCVGDRLLTPEEIAESVWRQVLAALGLG